MVHLFQTIIPGLGPPGTDHRPRLVAVLRMLLSRAAPVRLDEIAESLDVDYPDKVFESLRRKLDPGSAREGWRWFRARGGAREPKRYALDRSAGFRCVVLLPIVPER